MLTLPVTVRLGLVPLYCMVKLEVPFMVNDAIVTAPVVEEITGWLVAVLISTALAEPGKALAAPPLIVCQFARVPQSVLVVPAQTSTELSEPELIIQLILLPESTE